MQLYGIVLELVGVGFPNPSDAGPSPFAGGETPPRRSRGKDAAPTPRRSRAGRPRPAGVAARMPLLRRAVRERGALAPQESRQGCRSYAAPFASGEPSPRRSRGPPLRLELKGEYHGQKLLRQSIWDIETER
jgi:hypothetical protein